MSYTTPFYGRRRYPGLRSCEDCAMPASTRVCWYCSERRAQQPEVKLQSYADVLEEKKKQMTHIEPGQLIQVISETTILTAIPDSCISDDNMINGRISRGEVGIALAICDVEHSDGQLVEEMFVVFPGGIGWNVSSCFLQLEITR